MESGWGVEGIGEGGSRLWCALECFKCLRDSIMMGYVVLRRWGLGGGEGE